MKKTFILSLFFLVLEEGLKYFLWILLKEQTITVIPHFFELTYVKNTGAAWGILSSYTTILIIVSILLLFVVSFILKDIPNHKYKDIAASLLYAGMIGNLIDRVIFSYVRDFFSFQILSYSFPVFNIADVYIVGGVGLLLLLLWKGNENEVRSRNRRKSSN